MGTPYRLGLRVFDLSSGAPRIDATRVLPARAAYGQLRNDLKREWKRLRGRVPPLTPVEDRWYAPVIHEAVAHLPISTHARPERWYTGLEDVREELQHAVTQMHSAFGLTEA